MSISEARASLDIDLNLMEAVNKSINPSIPAI